MFKSLFESLISTISDEMSPSATDIHDSGSTIGMEHESALNPTTGLPMLDSSGLDSGGNPYGMDLHSNDLSSNDIWNSMTSSAFGDDSLHSSSSAWDTTSSWDSGSSWD